MANLRQIAKNIEEQPSYDDVLALTKAADSAETMAFDLSSLLDGQEDDELGTLLTPIRDFLKNLAGIES